MDLIESFLLIVTYGMIGLLLVAVGGIIIDGVQPREDVSTVTFGPAEPIALNDMQGIQGRFSGGIFIVSGVIRDVEYYVFYYKEPDGAIMMGKVRVETTKVYEVNDTPVVSTVTTQACGKWLHSCYNTRVATTIKVPPGTVKRNINLDLEM